MITAKNGHMCLNCGYAESSDPHKTPLVPADKAAPEVKPEADSPPPESTVTPTDNLANRLENQVKHDMAEAIAEVEKPAKPKKDEPKEPVLDADETKNAPLVIGASEIVKTKGMSKTEDKPVDGVSPRGRIKGALDLKPSREDLAKGVASVSAVDAIGPSLAAPDKVVDEEAPEAVVAPVEAEPAKKVENEPEPKIETEPVSPVPTVEPESVKTEEAPNPVADTTPVHVVDHAAEAEEAAVIPQIPVADSPEPVPAEPVPAPVETSAVPEAPFIPAEPAVAVASEAPVPTPAKEPLLAVTHPEGSSPKKVIMIVGGLVIVTCATLAAYYFTSSDSVKKVGQNANVSRETPAAGKGESAAALDSTATPSPSVAATPNASSAQARDLKRKADIAAYAAAVKAAATNGYYPTAAPGISGAIVDPTTGKSYAVATTPAANLGTIQYLAGGKCNAPSVTPGKTSTRFIALSTKLETDSAPYCLDVQ